MVVCTLTLIDDHRAVYEDSLLHKRELGNHVTGPLGGDELLRRTAKLLSRWVATQRDTCRRPELQILGRHLFEIAFGGPELGRAFRQTYGVFQDITSEDEQLRLRLVVGSGVQTLGTLPWEFLYMPWDDDGFFLAGERTRLILTRYVPNSDRPPQEDYRDDDPKLRILIVTSRPAAPGLGIVNADDVVDQVVKLQSDLITVEELDTPTRETLRRRVLKLKPHIVHLIGHGQPGQIALRHDDEELARRDRLRKQQRDLGQPVDPVHEADWVDSASVCTLLRQGLDERGGPGRLVFLHACNGATSLEAFNSVALALAKSERIAAVVAMQYEIDNTDAKRFASVFYSQLAERMPVDEAVTVARRELGEMPNPGHQSWDDRNFGTPVVYLRSADPLFRHVRRALHGTAGDPAPPAPAGLPPKGPCPNQYCRSDGLVFRAKGRCPDCGARFVTCPRTGCIGMVVTVPDSECSVCDYKFERVTVDTGRPHPADPQPAGTPTATPPAPAPRPGGLR